MIWDRWHNDRVVLVCFLCMFCEVGLYWVVLKCFIEKHFLILHFRNFLQAIWVLRLWPQKSMHLRGIPSYYKFCKQHRYWFYERSTVLCTTFFKHCKRPMHFQHLTFSHLYVIFCTKNLGSVVLKWFKTTKLQDFCEVPNLTGRDDECQNINSNINASQIELIFPIVISSNTTY